MGFEAEIFRKREELAEKRAERGGDSVGGEKENNPEINLDKFEHTTLNENPIRINYFDELTFTTESGNTYVLRSMSNNEYVLLSTRDNKEVIIEAAIANGLTIQCGKSFRYGSLSKTSTVISGSGISLKK